ncbi:hypothetical protein K1T71_007986 [Dendrolimus kikuchii]|uniref:Uncharacterized protein n=1 Tax=Dendrolimus kikuchii TaxID=765133 RepID=A0ACC1CYY9_9NEOP|nr:hypothetical protein K1T71_007986 [Dendrolimus kikuchii]
MEETDADDMFVVIVGDGENKAGDPQPLKPLKVDNIINTAVKLGEFVQVNVKLEPKDSYEIEYIEDMRSTPDQLSLKTESDTTDSENDNNEENDEDDQYVSEKQTMDDKIDTKEVPKSSNHYRRTLLKPSECKSYIEELRKQYPELAENQDLLIDTVAELMRNVKIPDPPEDFCEQNGARRICKYCDAVTSTFPAAVRHYQEKHGPRYLVCYACGFEFKSTTIMYKHEFRCRAPDAVIVKKARAKSVGNKARARPFIQFYKKQKPVKFPCKECSAVFTSKSTLISHENLHKGQRPYQCYHCPNAYTSQYAFSRHLKKHSNIDYICDYCGKAFKIKSLLVSHMHTHSQIKKFACEFCEKRFRQRGALNHHVNTVHKKLPPPCACQICEKRYPRMSLLKVHMNKAHGLVLMTREMFVKALPTMSEIQLKQAARVVLKSEVESMNPKRKKTEEDDDELWDDIPVVTEMLE